MGEFYRDNESGEVVEVRYLDIPGRELAANGLREIDEIVYRDLHLETLDSDSAYIRVAGLMVNVRAVKRGYLSITCEPDDCTLVDVPADCLAHEQPWPCDNELRAVNTALSERLAAVTAALEGAREPLAEYAHRAWSGWMRYLFEKSVSNPDGTVTLPTWAVERWTRQTATAYADLPDGERESDRQEADEMLRICRAILAAGQPAPAAAEGA